MSFLSMCHVGTTTEDRLDVICPKRSGWKECLLKNMCRVGHHNRGQAGRDLGTGVVEE